MTVKYIGKCLLIDEKGEKVLVIGDLHFGYEEALEKAGVGMGRKMYEETLGEMKEIINNVGELDKIILLGDLKHGFGRGNRQEWDEIGKIIKYLGGKCRELIIIRGNHDNYLENIAMKEKLKVTRYYVWEKYCFLHGDKDIAEAYDKKIKIWILGHVHPAVVLKRGAKSEKYKCFLSGKYKDWEIVILPSFFPFTEGIDIANHEPNLPWKINLEKFDILVVGEKLEVLNFGRIEKFRKKY